MLLFDPAPAPLLEPPEYLRRSLEVVSTVGAGVAEGRVPSETGSVGSELALFGFYRPSPYFAAGAGVRWNAFPAWPTGEGGGARFAGVAGRLYFLESGASDPYFELEVGVSSLRIDDDGGFLSSDLAGAARGPSASTFTWARRRGSDRASDTRATRTGESSAVPGIVARASTPAAAICRRAW